MRQFQTSVLDFKFAYDRDFTTAPFECAWASEAIFFVRIEEVTGENASLTLHAQISVDGIRWIDEGSTLDACATGDYFLRVRHFGGFLRLRGTISGTAAQFQLTNNIVLKE